MRTIRSWPSRIHSYEIGREIGRGSYSRVFRAINQTTHELCAMKIIPRITAARDPDFIRVRQEASAMFYLSHPNLIRLKEAFTDDTFVFLVLDLCEGGDLLQHVLNHGPLDEPTCALVFAQIASALAHCHARGIAHRDLKPENVLITEFPMVKLGDFGLSGFATDGELMTVFCGSPCYLAPECHRKLPYDGRKADIWSLGVMLCTMATGSFPWTALTKSHEMVKQILKGEYVISESTSDECRSLLDRMLQVDPKQRIGMDGILAHPFLKRAEQSEYWGKIEAPSLGPPEVEMLSPEEVLARFPVEAFAREMGEKREKETKRKRAQSGALATDFRSGLDGSCSGNRRIQGLARSRWTAARTTISSTDMN
jgi:serine/threonine protein kinase